MIPAGLGAYDITDTQNSNIVGQKEKCLTTKSGKLYTYYVMVKNQS